MTEKKIGVVFDCDGTLIDSMNVWRELEDDLARRAHATLTKEDTDALTTMTIPECSAYMHEKFGLGESPMDVVAMIDDFMSDYYANRCVARPGALELVRGLHEAGIPMAVASSSPKHLLDLGLAHVGMAHYLEAIVSVDQAGKSKRDPDVYDLARASLGTTRENTWGVEDSLYAVFTLKNAGYRTLAIYDCDMAGSQDDLKREADAFVEMFEGFTAQDFLALS